jgi:hypothetical protein
MKKTSQLCPKCQTPLSFRKWSERYPKGFIWQEALADCLSGCGKFGLRYFDGKPHSEPYQVRVVAEKTEQGSYRISKKHKAAICAIYGSVQEAIDYLGLLCMTEQSKP